MANKKKKGGSRRRAHSLSPINKQGVKVGTLMMEVGAVYSAFNPTASGVPFDQAKAGNYGEALKGVVLNFSPSSNAGKVFWIGTGIAVAGKALNIRNFGPLQLR